MKSLTKFNTAIFDFVNDLKSMQMYQSDIQKLETYIEIVHVNARSIIRNFQTYFLRDVFVRNLLNNNVTFFVSYDASQEESIQDEGSNLIRKIQSIVQIMQETGGHDNIHKTLNWIKILCFHAYADLNIDPVEKFKSLQQAPEPNLTTTTTTTTH